MKLLSSLGLPLAFACLCGLNLYSVLDHWHDGINLHKFIIGAFMSGMLAAMFQARLMLMSTNLDKKEQV